jgi:hypothetical protein
MKSPEKIIRITKCHQCPHLSIEHIKYCDNQMCNIELLDYDSPIPNWCPLEEYTRSDTVDKKLSASQKQIDLLLDKYQTLSIENLEMRELLKEIVSKISYPILANMSIKEYNKWKKEVKDLLNKQSD